jgi:MoaA/NifB/PqqE/SkfB family radical SAM enzyme
MGITERIDAITAIDPERKRAVIPAPRSVKVELTGRCNFSWAFCARAQRLRKQGDIDVSFFERILREMRRAEVEEIGLFYLGESFLVKWLPEAVCFAKQEAGFPYVFLTTNGSISSPERMDACLRAGLDSLKFSLNYADAEQFTEIAHVKPSLFAAMLKNIEAAREVRDRVAEETGHRCGLYASYIHYDGEQGARMAEVVEQVAPYLDEIYALPLYNQADLVSDACEDWSYSAGNRGRLGALRDPIPCWAIFTEGHITWDGKLSACCFDHDGRFHMGDLTKETFMQAWNSIVFRRLRRAHLDGDVSQTVCGKCVAYQ